MPDWLGTGIFGLITMILGGISKVGYDRWQARKAAAANDLTRQQELAATQRAQRASELARLQELYDLLNLSRSLYVEQTKLRNRLYRDLQRNHPGEVPTNLGYEDTFIRMFPHFTEDEAELHTMIRAITKDSLFIANERTRAWLKAKENLLFKNAPPSQGKLSELAELLRQLESHLDMWSARYQATIPHNPKRALVYLADERGFGVGFPVSIEEIVGEVISNYDERRSHEQAVVESSQ